MWKHLHDRIISLGRKICAIELVYSRHPLFIQAHLPTQESERSCKCVLTLLCAEISVKSGGVKIVLCAQTSPLCEIIPE
jgi:endonuclease III